jgi:hypothetical protein
MRKLELKTEQNQFNDKTRTPLQDSELSIDDFMKRLRVSGRYFVGNEERKTYLRVHSSEIEAYLQNLEAKNQSEAKLLREYVRINLKYESKQSFGLDDRISAEEKRAYFPKKPVKKLSHYTPIPRKKVERLIFASILVLSLPAAFYVGKLCKDKLEKAVSPYINKIYNLTETSDFYDGED